MKHFKKSRIPLSILAWQLLLSVALAVDPSPELKQSSFVNLADFGLNPNTSARENKVNLQKAIDWAQESGAVLWLAPSSKLYPVDGGLVLKKNVSLVGGNGPVGRGTAHPTRNHPVGSVFLITDKNEPFITI